MRIFRSYGACTAIGVALMVVAAVLGAQEPKAPSCRFDGWRSTRPFTARDGRPLYVETPSVVQLTAGTAYVGSPAFIWHSADAFLGPDSVRTRRELEPYLHSFGALLLADGSVRPIPAPVDALRPRSPMAVTIDGRESHVVWATARDTTRIDSDALMYARFDGERWSPVERIIDGTQLAWTPPSASVALVNDAAAIAVPSIDTTDRASHAGVEVFWRRDGSWSRSRVRTNFRFVGGAAIADDGRGRPIVIYSLLAQDSAGRDRPAVAVARTEDGAPTWSESRMITWLDGWSAHDLQLVRAGTRLYALWGSQRDDRSYPTRIDVFESLDAGATWAPLPALEFTSEIVGLRAVALANDGIVVSALQGRETRVLVVAALVDRSWSREEWRDPPPWSMPRMTAFARDSLLLTWGTAKNSPVPGIGEAPFPVLYQARLRVSCKRTRP